LTAVPQKILTSIMGMAYDDVNDYLYLFANTTNSSNTMIINQQAYQSVVRYDKSTFTSVADVSTSTSGNPTAVKYIPNSNRLIFSFQRGNAVQRQPAKTSSTRQPYLGIGGVIDMNASLTITAPINYYDGSTGSAYTLQEKGNRVQMTWSSQTNSWWV
jgi:hypothetical protein